MTTVYKKGGSSSPNNYQPITLTFTVGKIMESIIRDHHLIRHNLILPQQHGFVPGKSCVSQLITAISHRTQACNNGYNTDLIYFAFLVRSLTLFHMHIYAYCTSLKSMGSETNC